MVRSKILTAKKKKQREQKEKQRKRKKKKQREYNREQGRPMCGPKLYVALWSIMCGILVRHKKEKNKRLKCIELTLNKSNSMSF